MSWFLLIFAGFFEVIWAVAMKKSQGFTLVVPTVIMLIAMVASFALLALAMRHLPLSTAYMVWTGIGAVGAFVVGVACLGEVLTVQKVVAALLISLGILVMKLS